MTNGSENNENQSEKTPYGTSLLKAAMILEYLADQEGARGVSEIARNTGLSKATVFKLLETMQQIRFVEKEDTQALYGLGLGLARLARSSLQKVDIATIARPYLEELNRIIGETIHLGVREQNQVVYVIKLESNQAVRMYSRVGISAPMYCTGIGKALLSCLNDDTFRRYVESVELKGFTDRTIVSKNDLEYEIGLVKERGYAIDDSEHEEDVRCIALPLYLNERVFSAISITAPKYRMNDETLLSYLPALKKAQKEILDRARLLL